MSDKIERKNTDKIKIKSSDYGIIGLIKENNGIIKFARDFREHFLRNFPPEKDDHFFAHTYDYSVGGFVSILGFYKQLYEYFDISPSMSETLEHYVYEVRNLDANRTKEKFRLTFKGLIENLENADKQIMKKLNMLNKTECFRLNESILCLNIDCNLASVVMSVSAVEHRLHKLLLKANKKIYKHDFETAALGGIIELFRKDSR